MNTNDLEKRYIRISTDSGCYLADYIPMEAYENSIIIINDTNEKSGYFSKTLSHSVLPHLE